MNFLKGDCLEVMKTLPDKSVDCFVCDLPYGCLTSPRATCGAGWRKEVESGKKKTLYRESKKTCAWDIKIDLEKFWTEVKRLAKNDHTPVLMFCNARFGNDLYNSNPSWFRHDLIWNKSRGVGFLCANKQPLRSHELIYVFSKKGAYYKRVDIEGDFPETVKEGHIRSKPETIGIYGKDYTDMSKSNKGIRCVKSVITVANEINKTGKHPTQKPEELYEWLLKRYCPEGGNMLDPSAGSFTSCFTAHKLGIKATGIEMNEEFYDKAVKYLSHLNL
jgi:site-specific DNA-methyltransferase (adenine-specific)